MTAPPPRRPWWKRKRAWAAVAVWLLVAPYAFGYFGLMRRRPGWVIGTGAYVYETSPTAVYSHPWLAASFAPAERLDRAVRPNSWRPRPPRSVPSHTSGRRRPNSGEANQRHRRGVWPAPRPIPSDSPPRTGPSSPTPPEPRPGPPRIYGYDLRPVNENGVKDMSEVTFATTPEDLQPVAAFLLEPADELEAEPRSIQWHRHLPGTVRPYESLPQALPGQVDSAG